MRIATKPANSRCSDLIGAMKGSIQVEGDILSTGIKWCAQSPLQAGQERVEGVIDARLRHLEER